MHSDPKNNDKQKQFSAKTIPISNHDYERTKGSRTEIGDIT